MKNNRWLLPEGIAEVLPPFARNMEDVRRCLLDMYASFGYELVIPPMVEYLESLLTGIGDDLDLQTFKLTDQLNGRMMGVRADITPQVARIDAHQLKRESATRLCYIGTVLHTRPQGHGSTRSPLQAGLELYGHAGIESDVEVFGLMAKTIERCGVDDVYFDLGHVGIYRGLVEQAELNGQQQDELFDALQRKAKPELVVMLAEWKLPAKIQAMFIALIDLNGGEAVLEDATKALKAANKDVKKALQELEQIAAAIKHNDPDISLHYDLAELRGYHYHTGVVFGAFVQSRGYAIAQGGRYDGIGKDFGNARAATGFSTDLKTLLELSTRDLVESLAIMAPYKLDSDLNKKMASLREQGECVVVALPGDEDNTKKNCDRQLLKQGADWVVTQL